MNCKICNNKSKQIFVKKILGKYEAQYFQCVSCNFIQVKNPHWLNEAYVEAISSLDTGLVSRNLYLSSVTEALITKYFDYRKKFIDYGGGYGLFVRLMRDRGFDFYRQDKYCQNLFAIYFDVNDLIKSDTKFELLTAFELFEHLEDPLAEVEKMLKFADSILFSTELQPKNIIEREDWWYFSPESGQHISFYTKESLEALAEKFNLNLYTDNNALHILTRKVYKQSPFKINSNNIYAKIQGRLATLFSFLKTIQKKLEGFTQKDYQFIKSKLKDVENNS